MRFLKKCLSLECLVFDSIKYKVLKEVYNILISAINIMRKLNCMEIFTMFNSKKVLNFCAGWGGSMVASAAIFGKDYGCRIVYVDFSEYIKDLRKPMPGSEILNVVYNPFKNQPEIFLK
jgi:hypothetical protein